MRTATGLTIVILIAAGSPVVASTPEIRLESVTPLESTEIVQLDPPLDRLDAPNATTFLDFAHWGYPSASSGNRERGAVRFIPRFTARGTVSGWSAGPRFAWSSGTPTRSTSGVRRGVSVGWPNPNGFGVRLPAPAELVRCTLYGGTSGAEGRLDLSLTDGAAAPVTTYVAAPAFAAQFVFRGNAATSLDVGWTFQRGMTTGRVVLYGMRCEVDPTSLPPYLSLDRHYELPPHYGPGISTLRAFAYRGNYSAVTFYSNGVPIGTVTEPFDIDVDLPAGWSFFQAIATRAEDGRQLRSGQLRVPAWIGGSLNMKCQTLPDNDPLGLQMDMWISDVPAGKRVVDAFARMSFDHDWVSDLVLTAHAPDGTAVTLASRHGGDGDDYVDTGFWDGAGASIADGAPPFVGVYRPVDALAAFRGKDPNGPWTLRASDQAPADIGCWLWAQFVVLVD